MSLRRSACCLPPRKAIRWAALLSVAIFAGVQPAHGQVTINPPSRTERVGDHLAYLASAGGQLVLSWQWSLNGANLAGQTSSSLSLTNIQLTNTGTYTVQAMLNSGPASAAATLFVSNSFLTLASSNLVVARIGDGLQTLNTTTGNTLYLDQFETNGSYISTVMVPDNGNTALIVEGSGTTTGLAGSVLTLSSNQQYLNFAGYNQSLPNGGVTFTGSNLYRAIGAVNGLGYYTLCLTNDGLYDGSSGQVRCAVSVDGIVNNFWTGGIVASPNLSIKTLTANQGASGIPEDGCGYDPRVLGIFGGNLWVSSGNSSAGQAQGLYSFSGLPSGSPQVSATQQIATSSGSDPDDFAFSPDGSTVYIADDDNYTGSTGTGGVERWDYNGSAWAFNYTLGTGAGNWGARGLAVDFSQFPGGGASARGAVVYATTAESTTNRLIRIFDSSGGSSMSSILAAAGTNQLFRGLRFGPQSAAGATQSDIDYLNVTNYGAVGDGMTDDTVAFENALSACGTNHLGIYVPPGRYIVSSTLTVNLEEIMGRFAGGWPADTTPLPTLLLRNLSGPGLILGAGASVHGVALDYDHGTPATTNAPAIQLNGNGIAISSVCIENAYDAINTATGAEPGRARFSDIYIVSPAHVGIQITKCYDFVQYRNIEVRCPNAMSSGAAFVFERVDEGSYTGLVASNCLTGLEFDYDASTSPAGGSFTGGFSGCSIVNCANGILVNGPHKIKITGGDCSSTNYGISISNAAEVTLAGGQWQTAPGPAVQVLSASNVIINAGMFSRPWPVAAPLATVNNCTQVTLSHCQFLSGSTGLQLGAGNTNAVVVGNSFEDGGISNFMTSGYIVASSLITASAPAGLTAVAGSRQVALNWELAVGATNYYVERSLASGGPYTLVGATTATNYTDTGLTNGVTYYYVVAALRASGQSANSSEANATPMAPTLGFGAGSGQLSLFWPGWAAGFTLYMTTNLSPAAWQPVTNPVQSNNGFFNVNLSMTNSAQEFFELSSPSTP